MSKDVEQAIKEIERFCYEDVSGCSDYQKIECMPEWKLIKQELSKLDKIKEYANQCAYEDCYIEPRKIHSIIEGGEQ